MKTSFESLTLLDEVHFTFEKRNPITLNDSKQKDELFPGQITDGNHAKDDLSDNHNQVTNNETDEEPITPHLSTTPETSETTESVEGFYDNTIENEVIELVNSMRLELGIEELEKSESLIETARLKSEDMAKYNYFSHEGHLTFASLLEAYQIPCQISGENIFKSQNPLLVASEIFEVWKQSPTHYANMTNEKFKKIGVGVYGIEQEGVRIYYVTQHLTD